MDQIWFRDPLGFFNTQSLHEIIPLAHMTFAQKLNAIFRFALYFALVLIVVKHTAKPFYLVIAVGAFTGMLYAVYEKDKEHFARQYSDYNLGFDNIYGGPCVLPTKNNPFANILVSDYALNPRRPPGCDINRRSVKKMAEKMFDRDLYKDVDDIWGRRTSSRTFYQMPVQTIPNNQNEFAKWLYGTGGHNKKRVEF